MKRILSCLAPAVLFTFLFASCVKKEAPYPVPPKPNQDGEFKLQDSQVKMGEDYETQIYFSFTTGIVATSNVKSWDLGFATDGETSELWLNSAKPVLIYPTESTNYESVVSKNNVAASAWKYDNPSGIKGKSALGLLTSQNHIGEVLIVDAGDDMFFKVQILEATVGSEQSIVKDGNYNFIYFSFNTGIVKPEPPKKDWDILFTRYRTVYYHYNPDGSDYPYPVNGVLTNPYKTRSGNDTTKGYDFYPFTLADAEKFVLREDRDVIGFNWKSVNINTTQYTVNPRRIYVIEDQNGALWKMHFVNFYDSDGKKGSPQFEYQRLK
jgi:hypothetical protein